MTNGNNGWELWELLGFRTEEEYERALREGRVLPPTTRPVVEGGEEGPPTPFDWETIIRGLLDEALETAVTRSTGRTTTTGRTVSTDVGATEQISRRFFDVPTEERFLDNFENAYGGFIQGMRERGLGSEDIALALDPATGLMDTLMDEYMGTLSQRALRGEDIFELVGTEEDFRLLRREPGTVSRTTGESKDVTTGETVSAGETTREGGEVISTSEQISTQRHEAAGTRESTFREITEVLARPEIAAVFKYSPSEFLAERFENEGQLAAFIQGRKGERARQRQTLAGAPVVGARRV